MNFTLPLLTFIWIATGQPIDQVKHPKPTPKETVVAKPQKAKPQKAKKTRSESSTNCSSNACKYA